MSKAIISSSYTSRLLWGIVLFLFCGIFVQAEDKPFQHKRLHFQGRASEVLIRPFTTKEQPSIIVLHRGEKEGENRYISFFHPENGKYPRSPSQMYEVSDTTVAAGIGDYLSSPGSEIMLLKRDKLEFITRTENGKLTAQKQRTSFSSSFFQFPDPKKLHYWPYTDDLNEDGRDDLILPASDGYEIFYQNQQHELKSAGVIAVDHQKNIETKPSSSSLFQFRTQLPNLMVRDFDGNNRTDLICTFQKRVAYYIQNENHQFSKQPTGVFRLKHLVEKPKKNRVQFTKVNLRDINGDGKPEIIITRISGKFGLFKSIRTSVYIYKGRGAEPHPWTPDQIIQIPGISTPPKFQDANGDGSLDMLVTALRTDLLTTAWKNMTGNLAIHHFVYLYDEESDYFGKESKGKGPPDYSHQVEIDKDSLEQGVDEQPMLMFNGDYNGDGQPDMFRMNSDMELSLHLGHQDPPSGTYLSFEDEPFFTASVKSPEEIHIEDINQDGISDLLIEYKSDLDVFLSQ